MSLRAFENRFFWILASVIGVRREWLAPCFFMGNAKMSCSVHSIVDSYEARVATVGRLIGQTADILKRLDLEQQEKVGELRDLLAKSDSLRRKDFDTIISDIWSQRREKEEQIDLTLSVFLGQQEELISWLREVIADGKVGLEEFKILSQDMLAHQKATEAELSRMLKELHLEQEELGAGLKNLLNKGDRVRTKDFKAMIRAVHVRQLGRQDEIGKMLGELWDAEEKVAIQWHKVLNSSRT